MCRKLPLLCWKFGNTLDESVEVNKASIDYLSKLFIMTSECGD